MRTFQNPILPGFHPDPSICRVDEDYYMVTSTFEYYPGLPIFHSKDLVNWICIGHAMDRASQLDLDDLAPSLGLFAPTIRYHEGIFYVICTNVGKGGNFVVTARAPEGPYSEPYWLSETGIDPSLFFDEDGKVYYCGNRGATISPFFEGACEIWLQELNLDTMTLVGEITVLWQGALKEAVWAEGPHIYKKDGFYYLLISEGGTAHEHALTIARSASVAGPYKGHKGNPILTHRHLGKDFPISNVGHGDLVKTQKGDWWLVLLGSRPYGGYYRNLGRETFLVPVIWEDDWPVVNPGKGFVESTMLAPNLPEYKCLPLPTCEQFDDTTLSYPWVYLRTPRVPFFSLTDRPSHLRLMLLESRLTQHKHVSFVGRRLQHKKAVIRTVMDFTPETENEVAGVVLMQNSDFNFQMILIKVENQVQLVLKQIKAGHKTNLAKVSWTQNEKPLYLMVVLDEQDLSFYYGESPKTLTCLIEHVDGRILSTDVAGGFVGAMVGLYASSQGTQSSHYADFDWFEYQPM